MLDTVREWCAEVRTIVAGELAAREAELRRDGIENEEDLEPHLQKVIDSFVVRIRSGANSRRKSSRGNVRVGNEPDELFDKLAPGLERLLEHGESVWLELVERPAGKVHTSLPLQGDAPQTLVPEAAVNSSAVGAMAAQMTENNKALLQHLTDQGVQSRRKDEVIFQLMMKLADHHAQGGGDFDPTAAIAAMAPLLAQVAAIMGARMQGGAAPPPSSSSSTEAPSSSPRPAAELTLEEADAELGPMWTRALELIQAHPQLLTAERKAAAAVALAGAA